MPPPSEPLTCRMCGHVHHPISLAPGERALCARCDCVLARGAYGGADAGLAFTAAGLILAVPAALLPVVTAQKVGNRRIAHLSTGVERLWHTPMALQAVPVFLFGELLPLLLLVTLAALLLPPRLGWRPAPGRWLPRVAEVLRHWAMPEVQVLAVLVAIVKLGSMVTITLGPGFWCYAAMSLMLLLAYRSYDLGSAARPSSLAGRELRRGSFHALASRARKLEDIL